MLSIRCRILEPLWEVTMVWLAHLGDIPKQPRSLCKQGKHSPSIGVKRTLIGGNFLYVFIDCHDGLEEHRRTWINENRHLLFTQYYSLLHHLDSVMIRYVVIVMV